MADRQEEAFGSVIQEAGQAVRVRDRGDVPTACR
jgi:hypothetical protein